MKVFSLKFLSQIISTLFTKLVDKNKKKSVILNCIWWKNSKIIVLKLVCDYFGITVNFERVENLPKIRENPKKFNCNFLFCTNKAIYLLDIVFFTHTNTIKHNKQLNLIKTNSMETFVSFT